MNPYFKETVETKEISRPEKPKLSTAFENEKKSDVRPVRILEPNLNADLAGKRHPITGIKFETKDIRHGKEIIRGVFPQFEGKDVERLPRNMYMASDSQQFSYCVKNLGQKLEQNPALAEKFTPRQLEQIRDGAPRISGLTWHHTEHPGRMQLVDAEIHSKTGHTSGRKIWGGGSECR